jgi:cysteinyl-tRNA synthetase
MAIKVYNTLTKKKTEFKPIETGKVKIYMCGPTVYDYFHIGNARSFIMSDIIRRYLEYRGFEVKYIMNITDIDDRIINRANEQKVTADSIAKEYTKAFFKDLGKLSIKKATLNPRATENIPEMIKIIESLINIGFAYQLANDVYFSIEKFNGYGKLSGKKIDELIAGARVDVDEFKRSPIDFALWKGAKEGEPFWESPWGNGRPGWHIECSAMAMKYLGETIDIHCGGNDLIFPHHENEIAQSESSTGKTFANYWIHFGFLNIDNEKMSKSLGNFFTAREILDKYSINVIRLYFLQTHYSAPLNFSDDGLEAAKNGYYRLRDAVSELKIRLSRKEFGNETIDLQEFERQFTESMDDDFNTPKATAVMFELAEKINIILAAKKDIKYQDMDSIVKFFEITLQSVFGISMPKILDKSIDMKLETHAKLHIIIDSAKLTETILKNRNVFEKLTNNTISQILSEQDVFMLSGICTDIRHKARMNKDWNKADKIRNDLKNMGIILEDRKDGTTIWKVT